MLTEIYIEALLIDEQLADQVWELWNARLASDELAAMAWWLMASDRSGLREVAKSAASTNESRCQRIESCLWCGDKLPIARRSDTKY